jgi:hypothetical protein
MARVVTLDARLWTAEDVAERWELSPRTLANWRSLGLGPAYIKVGRSVLYRESDLAAYEDEKRRAS